MRPLVRSVQHDPGVFRRAWRFFTRLLGKREPFECRRCHGTGSIPLTTPRGKDLGIVGTCFVCDGTGWVWG